MIIVQNVIFSFPFLLAVSLLIRRLSSRITTCLANRCLIEELNKTKMIVCWFLRSVSVLFRVKCSSSVDVIRANKDKILWSFSLFLMYFVCLYINTIEFNTKHVCNKIFCFSHGRNGAKDDQVKKRIPSTTHIQAIILASSCW